MKKLQIGLVLSLFVLIGLVAMSFALVDKVEPVKVEPEIKSEVKASTTWHFTGNDPNDILNPLNWEEGASPDICDTEDTLELPCTFETNVSIVDAEALIDYFETEYPDDTADHVVENALSTRDPQ